MTEAIIQRKSSNNYRALIIDFHSITLYKNYKHAKSLHSFNG